MTATIVILPVVPVIHADESVPMTLRLSHKEYNRLCRYAKRRKLSPDETAVSILKAYLELVSSR